MGDQLDPNVVKATQISLGKYVKRPPLTEKLLKKPPFRFLHDIVTSVLKNKGFFEGLFEENELISDNVKDRDSKISFLNKVISVVSLTTGQSLTVKSSKIVSGQEPEKTNELLQCLALALDKNLSSHEAVKQYKAGVKIPLSNDRKSKDSLKSVKNTIDSKKLTSKSNEKIVTEKSVKSKTKETNINKKESPPKKTVSKVSNKKPTEKTNKELLSQQHDSAKLKSVVPVNKTGSDNIGVEDINSKKLSDTKDTVDLDTDSEANDKTIQQNANSQEDTTLPQDISLQEHTAKPEDATIEQAAMEIDDSIKKPTSAERQSSLKHKQLETETEVKTNDNGNKETKKDADEGRETLIYNAEDDTSAVGANKGETDDNRAPVVNTTDKKVMSNSTNTIPPIRPSSSRPGAPRLRDKIDIVNDFDTDNIIMGKVNIISENALQEEEEDTSIIIENETAEMLGESLENQKQHEFVSTQNSHLVHQILDSQKEYSQTSGKTEIEWQFGAQRTPDIFIQEMEQLKFSVQALSRIANPLGKLLDHIQEDVEVMRQELQQWTTLYEDTSKELLKQKTANAESLLPFHTKLKQLNTDIEEKHDKITEVKVSIHKNASRIEKLLANGIVQ